MYEKEGIIITVTNNKRKALTKVNMILNFDFTEEMLNKYSIYEEANIINFNNKVRIYKKRFNGGNIYDYEINMNKDRLEEIVGYKQELIKKNYLKDIYEAQLYKKQSFEFLRKLIKDDKIEINYLLGNNMKY